MIATAATNAGNSYGVIVSGVILLAIFLPVLGVVFHRPAPPVHCGLAADRSVVPNRSMDGVLQVAAGNLLLETEREGEVLIESCYKGCTAEPARTLKTMVRQSVHLGFCGNSVVSASVEGRRVFSASPDSLPTPLPDSVHTSIAAFLACLYLGIPGLLIGRGVVGVVRGKRTSSNSDAG